MQLTRQKLDLMNIVAWHDIQNKITGLRGYVELTKVITSDEEASAFIRCEEEILRKIHDELQFTEEYQEIGMRVERWVNVATAIARAVSEYDDETISVKLEIGSLEIFCDPILRRMFTHLLDNSKKYCMVAPDIRVCHRETPDGLLLTYEDNSTGIPENRKKGIFIRNVGKANCYGLIFAHDLLELSGISIRETGIPGKGARFEIVVPRGAYRFDSRSTD